MTYCDHNSRAYDAARRRLEDFARRQRGVVKHREEACSAQIGTLFQEQGHGFIITPDGREIHFFLKTAY